MIPDAVSLQINDTHLHSPLKAFHTKCANVWYFKKVDCFREELRKGKITNEEYHAKLHALMGMGMLRNLAPKWLWSACEHIREMIPEENRNLIKKGWDQLYFDPAKGADFLAEARREEATWAAAAAAAAAAEEASRAAKAAEAAGEAAHRAVQALVAGAAAGLSTNELEEQVTANLQNQAAPAAISPPLDSLEPLSDDVIEIAREEQLYHESQVPKLSNTPSKSKTQRGSKPKRRITELMGPDDTEGGPSGAGVGASGGGQSSGVGGGGGNSAGRSSKYDGLSGAQLKELCQDARLPKYGNKAELVKRLQDRDARLLRQKRPREGEGAGERDGDGEGGGRGAGRAGERDGDGDGEGGVTDDGDVHMLEDSSMEGRRLTGEEAQPQSSPSPTNAEPPETVGGGGQEQEEEDGGMGGDVWGDGEGGLGGRSEEGSSSSDSESEGDFGADQCLVEEGRAKVCWRSYLEALTQGKKKVACNRLVKVLFLIDTVILTSENAESESSFPEEFRAAAAKRAKLWRTVRDDIGVAVHGNTQHDFQFP